MHRTSPSRRLTRRAATRRRQLSHTMSSGTTRVDTFSHATSASLLHPIPRRGSALLSLRRARLPTIAPSAPHATPPVSLCHGTVTVTTQPATAQHSLQRPLFVYSKSTPKNLRDTGFPGRCFGGSLGSSLHKGILDIWEPSID
jgi:hypothetical protein